MIPVHGTQDDSDVSFVESLGKKISELVTPWKNVVVTMLTLTYSFGYAAWQIYAWRNGFGTVTALNTQYFTAGLAFFICSTLLLIMLGLWIYGMESVAAYLVKKSGKIAERIRRIHQAFRWSAMIVVIVSLIPYILAIVRSPVGFWAIIALISLFAFPCFFWVILFDGNQNTANAVTGWSEFAEQILPHGKMFVLVSLSSIVIYTWWVYPEIPQELGGGRPKVCYIDMDKEKMSDMIIAELVSTEPIIGKEDGTDAEVRQRNESIRTNVAKILDNNVPPGLEPRLKILHSKELDLWFDSTDYIIVRVHDKTKENEKSPVVYEPKVVRIPKNLFMSITIHRLSYKEKVRHSKEFDTGG